MMTILAGHGSGSLKHADSEGALLVVKERRSLPTTAEVSSLRSNPRIPGMIQTHQDLESSTGSLYSPDDTIPHEEQEEEQKKTDDEDQEVLMEDEQDRDEHHGVIRENWPMSKSRQTSLEEKCDQTSDSLVVLEQSSSEQHSSQKMSCLLRDTEQDVKNPLHNYPETVVPRYNADPEIRDLCNGGQHDAEDSENCVQNIKPMSPPDRDLMDKVEDMEVGEEANGGLLLSSVPDKPRDFSKQLTWALSSQNILGPDGSCDNGCPSSFSESQRICFLSCSTENHESNQDQECRRSASEKVKETVPDSLFRPPKKQETLSKKDRMLIHKIRRYYKHAEHQDASFAIKRRESLSYIPPGLVRNLSQQLNDVTSDEDIALHKRASSITRPTSWSVFSLPGLENENTCNSDSKFQDEDKMLGKDEEFHPASDVVKAWQEMELKRLGSSEEPLDSLESTEGSCITTPDQEKKAEISKMSSDSGLGEALLILEESDEGSSPSKVNVCLENEMEFQSHPNQEHKIYERHKLIHNPLPKLISVRSANEEDLILQEMEKMKNKVFQLARQYSQRIKNNRPVVRQRPKITESHFMPKSLSSVMEEKPSGLPARTMSLDLNEPGLVQGSKSTSPSSSICSPGSPQFPYFCRLNIQRPPSPEQMENFHWPDVKELCSKYSSQGQGSVSNISHPYPLNRSVSFPERMLDREPSCTFTCLASCDDSMQKSLVDETVSSLCGVNSLDLSLKTHTHDHPDNCFVPADISLSCKNDLSVIEKARGVKQDLESAVMNGTEQGVSFRSWVRGGHPSCSMEESENSRQNLVKNLRDKFQNLSSYT